MKFSSTTLGGVLLTLFVVSSSATRADLIPWTYNWSRSPSEVYADAPGTGHIALTDEARRSAVGDSDIVATNMKTFSTATSAAPDIFTNKPYTLALYLQDSVSGIGETLTFTGLLNGRLTAYSANITSTPTGITSRTVKLGSNTYTVSIQAYTPPGVPGAINVGSVSAHVSVSGLIVATVPEPGSFALVSLGLGVLGAARWRSRRRSSRQRRGAE
ncbi:MAG: PEP-CTERM sorting domain-containing protein [Gemmataceae bacterium]